MAYMLLMMEPPAQRATRTEAEGREAYDSMRRFAEDLRADGLLLGVESLQGLQSAARVQVREGKARVVDGPFAEAKEMIGGYFLVDVPTREQAVEIAKRCPAAAWCTVEVRALGPCFLESVKGKS